MLVLFVAMSLTAGGALSSVTADESNIKEFLPAGKIVEPDDPDAAHQFSSPPVSICFLDLDGTNSYSTEDSVIVAFQNTCTGSSSGGDLRITNLEGHEAGQRLTGTSPDRGVERMATSPDPQFWYYDVAGNNRISPEDTVYLKLRDADQGTTRATDIRITPFGDFPAGSKVSVGDQDYNRGLTSIGIAVDHIRVVDLLQTTDFRLEDLVYLTKDAQRDFSGVGDVRLYTANSNLDFGTILGHDSPDSKGLIRTFERPLCFVDQNNSGTYTLGNPVYFAFAQNCGSNVSPGDIRFSGTSEYPAGSRVNAGDADQGPGYTAYDQARIGYLDLDGTGSLTPGNPVVLNLVSPGGNQVNAGDILLTPTELGAGQVLLDDHVYIGTHLQNLGLFRDNLAFIAQETATSPSRADPIYVAPGAQNDQGLRPGDVRLVSIGVLPFGGPVEYATGEILPSLTQGNANLCSFEAIPDQYDPQNPGVYLRLDGSCPSQVQPGLIRLLPFGTHDAFTMVRGGDRDLGASLASPTTTIEFKYFDADSNGRWSKGDTLYLDIRNPGDNGVGVGDIRLTPFGDLSGGSTVQGADQDIGMPLTVLGTVIELAGYVDGDQSNDFGVHDIVYVTPNANQNYVSALSVRLMQISAPFEVPKPIDPDPDPVDPDPVDSDPGPQPVDPDPTIVDPDPDEGDNEFDTPAPAIGIVLVFLAVFVFKMRKRR